MSKYRRASLKIAGRPNISIRPNSLLELGCGINRDSIGDASVVWMDIDIERLSPGLNSVCAQGERLPFADGSFDLVISRLAIPYMDIPVMLREVNRVLKPGGIVWVSLHDIRYAGRRILQDIKGLHFRSVVFNLYSIANGLMLELSGRLYRFPLNNSILSIQTVRGMAKALIRSGFSDVEFDDGTRVIVMAARKDIQAHAEPQAFHATVGA
ncbi:MAG: methyltransferase domain-containing protein [Candidatus Acidiferrales bacterium]